MAPRVDFDSSMEDSDPDLLSDDEDEYLPPKKDKKKKIGFPAHVFELGGQDKTEAGGKKTKAGAKTTKAGSKKTPTGRTKRSRSDEDLSDTSSDEDNESEDDAVDSGAEEDLPRRPQKKTPGGSRIREFNVRKRGKHNPAALVNPNTGSRTFAAVTSLPCLEPDCPKTFTRTESLKSHLVKKHYWAKSEQRYKDIKYVQTRGYKCKFCKAHVQNLSRHVLTCKAAAAAAQAEFAKVPKKKKKGARPFNPGVDYSGGHNKLKPAFEHWLVKVAYKNKQQATGLMKVIEGLGFNKGERFMKPLSRDFTLPPNPIGYFSRPDVKIFMKHKRFYAYKDRKSVV